MRSNVSTVLVEFLKTRTGHSYEQILKTNDKRQIGYVGRYVYATAILYSGIKMLETSLFSQQKKNISQSFPENYINPYLYFMRQNS